MERKSIKIQGTRIYANNKLVRQISNLYFTYSSSWSLEPQGSDENPAHTNDPAHTTDPIHTNNTNDHSPVVKLTISACANLCFQHHKCNEQAL